MVKPVPHRTREGVLFGLALLAVAVIGFAYAFQWKLLREPVNRYVSEKTGRHFAINGDLTVDLGRITHITLRQVQFENTEWAAHQPMVAADAITLSVDVLALLRGRVVLDQLALEGANVSLERNAEGLRNWTLAKSDDKEAQAPQIRQLSIRNSVIHYKDANYAANLQAQVDTEESDPLRPTRITLAGTYKNVRLSATAATGSVLSLQEASTLFPARIEGKIGSTTIKLDGTLSDLVAGGIIDAKLALSGPDLSLLYPVIPLVLPGTPAYRISGQLKRNGDVYRYEEFEGLIGNSDIRGSASYSMRSKNEPPMLKAELNSQQLDLADLGPLIGLKSKRKGQVKTKAAVPVDTAQATTPRKVLPKQAFRLERLNAMNADVTLQAGTILRPSEVALEDMRVRLLLENGFLKLDPLEFGFSGGKIAASLTLDGRKAPIQAQADIDLRNVKLQQLLPDSRMMQASAGTVGAQIRLQGKGNSIADMLAHANGEASLAMVGGELSGLLLEALNLNGSGILKYLAFGDKSLPNRCSVASFKIKDGIAFTQAMVFDTAISNIEGEGQINLRDEELDLRLDPQPKKKSILVARTPIRLQGSFSNPDYELEKSPLLARGGAALVLGALNPVAAIIALIETGPGKDADCKQLLGMVSGAQSQAQRSSKPTHMNVPQLEPLEAR